LVSRIFFCNFILRVKRYREREDGGIRKGMDEKGRRRGNRTRGIENINK
jgi:hypothetical protein